MSSAANQYTSSDLVLVTGANGHVGQHVIDQLLSLPNGPRVRGTVRSEGTAKQIVDFYNTKGIVKDKLEITLIANMVEPGAFDKAVKDVTHIAHIASPFILEVNNAEEDLLKPAMQGTVGLLQSALSSPSVKSVVVTSSFASVFDPKKGWRSGYTYTADDWNPVTFEEAASPDFDVSAFPESWRPTAMYCASKCVAERAVWEFQKNYNPHFSISCVLPVYIGGPSILPLTKGAGSLSLSQGILWNVATDSSKLPVFDYPGWVDVRDVAKAHINALIRPEAAEKRWIVASKLVSYSDIADIIRQKLPTFSPSKEVQKGDYYDIDAAPALSALGLGTYITLEQSVVDTVQQVSKAVQN